MTLLASFYSVVSHVVALSVFTASSVTLLQCAAAGGVRVDEEGVRLQGP